MGTFYSFEEIDAWQKSRDLVRLIRQLCKKDIVNCDYPFVDQITRAVRSVSANIAEGNDSLTSREFINFLGYVKRSCAEVRSHLFDALDEKYISKEEFENLSNLCISIGRMIAGLIHYLQQSGKDFSRTISINNHSKNQELVL